LIEISVDYYGLNDYYATSMPLIPGIQVNISTAKRDLSRLTNEVRYGGKRIILTSKGHPKVAMINLDYLSRLEQAMVEKVDRSRKQSRLKAFEKLKHLRQEIIGETQGKLPDPVEVLRQSREQRGQHLMDVVRGC
jgi:prevent-host-death family protein